MLLLAICASAILGFAALSFDLGYLYVTKNRLTIATDAAAMAAIRRVQDGLDEMTSAAQLVFDANLPSGLLMIRSPVLNPITTEPTTAGTTITVSSSANVPLFFARIFGKTQSDLTSVARATRRDKNVVLIMDYSGSLDDELPEIKDALKMFVDEFAEGSDNLGLVSYSRSARIDFDPQTTFKAGMHERIDAIETLGGSNMPLGLWYGYKALRDLVDPYKAYKLNALVFLSDARANTFPNTFNVATGAGACDVSPITAVRNAYGFSFYALQAPLHPVTSQPRHADCDVSPGSELGTSMSDRWYPPDGSIPGGVSIHGRHSTSTTDFTEDGLKYVARNMQLNIANAARSDPDFPVTIHTISYGSSDDAEMQIMANVQGIPEYVDTQESGTFTEADNVAEFIQALAKVASSIARLSQ